MNDLGVEMAHGFGDGLFQVPLIRSLSMHYNAKVAVAVEKQCADAFDNLPWISDIIHIPAMNHGVEALRQRGFRRIYQITPNIKFFEFRERDPSHSLIDTALWTGRELGLPNFDQRPVLIPTEREANVHIELNDPRPTIAVESVYKSGQSWADQHALQLILDKYLQSHRVFWLSNSGAPTHPNVDNLLRYTRREIIMSLRHVETFFSVGSGFFCGCLALPTELQPRRVVCLWRDEFYRYEARLAALNWHTNLIWIHNHDDLKAMLERCALPY